MKKNHDLSKKITKFFDIVMQKKYHLSKKSTIYPKKFHNYVNKVPPEEPNTIKILKTNANLAGFPDIIEPNGLSEEKMRDLEFFRDLVENSHKKFISKSY